MSLSLDEKLSLLTGDGFWSTKSFDGKIKYLSLSDGPHGLRKVAKGGESRFAEPAICYPTASALACSFDPELVGEIGDELGKECREKNVSVLLGPGVNMKRSPLCGRNFEYYSEDPFLAGTMATAFVNGVQKNGVGTSLKHFAANSQETHRMRSDSVIDERTLREIYLKAFEMVVKGAQPVTIMASYNLLNGFYSTENKWLLTDVLRKEWGYKGLVVSDWGACSNLTKAVKAGMDLEMPDTYGIHKKAIMKDLEEGLITEEEIEEAVNRLLAAIEKYGKTVEERDAYKALSKEEFLALDSTKRRHELALRAACETGVLLKNEGLLPLTDEVKILLVGDLAVFTRFQGGGSSHVNAGDYPTVYDCLKEKYPDLLFARGYDSLRFTLDENMEEEALNLAKDADVIIYCGGLTDLAEGEGYDRDTLKMPANQIHLIQKLLELEKKTVFLSFGGAPFEMESVEKFDAVLHMYLGGEAVAEAAVKLLTGEVNPSGHLAETWPLHIEDTPAVENFGSREMHIPYKEGLFIGYRHYVSKQIPVQFPFGYGLSYTDFEYSDLNISEAENGSKKLTFKVTNTGSKAGKAVPQIYVRNCAGEFPRAGLELKGFKKISLEPGETKEVTLILSSDAFSVYDVSAQAWVIPEGEYGICIGKSAEEIVLSENIFVAGVKDLKLPEPELAIREKSGPKFDITSSYAELAEYSETAKHMLETGINEIRNRIAGRDDSDPEVRMMIETLQDGTADAMTMMNAGMNYDILLQIIEEANKNYENH